MKLPTFIKKHAIFGFVMGLVFTIIMIGLLMLTAPTPAHADEWYSAHDTIVDAKIGTNAEGYYDAHEESSQDASSGLSGAYKSENLYLNNGDRVCFKLESDVSVAYYCN